MLGKQKKKGLIEIDDLKYIAKVARKSWHILLICVGLSALIAYLYAYKIPNDYGASTKILLNGSAGIYGESIIQGGGYGGFGYQTYVANSNQMQVIRSSNLIEEAMDRLKLDVSYFIVGRLKTTEHYKSTPFELKVMSISPRLYEQMFGFRILNEEEFELEYEKDGEPYIIKGNFDVEIINTELKIIISKKPSINEATIPGLSQIKYQIQVHNKQRLINWYKYHIDVVNPEMTNVLEITFNDKVSDKAVEFLDTLSKVYIENSLESKYELNRNTLFYIDKQLAEVIGILSLIEDTLENYKSEKGILDLSREERDYFEKLSGFDQQVSSFHIQIATLDDLENYIIADKDPEFLPPSVYVNSNDGFLQTSVTELYAMQIQKASALVGATSENFSIDQLKRRIEHIKTNLLTYIGNSRQAMLKLITNLENEKNVYRNTIRSIPKKQRELLNIQRKLQVNEKMYLFLLEKERIQLSLKQQSFLKQKLLNHPDLLVWLVRTAPRSSILLLQLDY